MKEKIGTFFGEPVSAMSKERLLDVIKYLAEDNKTLRKSLYVAEDRFIESLTPTNKE